MMSRVLGSDVEVDPAEVRESFGAELGTCRGRRGKRRRQRVTGHGGHAGQPVPVGVRVRSAASRASFEMSVQWGQSVSSCGICRSASPPISGKRRQIPPEAADAQLVGGEHDVAARGRIEDDLRHHQAAGGAGIEGDDDSMTLKLLERSPIAGHAGDESSPPPGNA